jgi:hypothetical protein
MSQWLYPSVLDRYPDRYWLKNLIRLSGRPHVCIGRAVGINLLGGTHRRVPNQLFYQLIGDADYL